MHPTPKGTNTNRTLIYNWSNRCLRKQCLAYHTFLSLLEWLTGTVYITNVSLLWFQLSRPMSQARLFVSHSEGRQFLRISCSRYTPPYSRAPLTRLLRGRRFNFVEDSRCMVPPIFNQTPYSPSPTRHWNWQGHVNFSIIPFLPPLVPIRITPAGQVK